VVVHTAQQAKQMDNILPGTPNVASEHKHGWWKEPGREVSRFDDLGKLVSGAARGRQRRDEITCFVNNVGIGLQFAAVGALVLQRARYAGVGHPLPDDWFSEDVHP
jgi:ornithine cyclodeaminase/alanine dehydrogenase-like protein (mu-crystallin family)